MIKEQIKAAIGMPSAPARGAGPSGAPAAASGAADGTVKTDEAGDGVQDLGVITGKRVRRHTRACCLHRHDLRASMVECQIGQV